MINYLIKEIRKIKNIKLKELSTATGVSMSYLSEIENNKDCNLSLIMAINIADALNEKLENIYFVDSEINSLKRALNIYVEVYGIQHYKTLNLSNEINKLINKRYGGIKMEKEILEEIEKECNFKERILLKVFTKTFMKVYNIARIKMFNSLI